MRLLLQGYCGGGYQFGGEAWGAFVPRSGSTVNEAVQSYLTYGRAKIERRNGWIELPDLDTAATARAVHMLQEASERGGLLGDAVKQLEQTWRNAPKRMKRHTWFGNLRRHLDDVWPDGGWSLDWSRSVAFWAEGVPLASAKVHLGRRFAKRRWQNNWLRRQKFLIQRRPALSSQDFLISKIVRARGPWARVLVPEIVDSDDEEDGDWQAVYESLPTSVIFPHIPSVQANVFKKLVSTLAGKEDFARVNAHHLRRDMFFFLHEENKKRCCLYCYTKRSRIILDSEWHSFFECPLTLRPRKRFFLIDTQSPDTHLFRHTHEVPDPLSLLVKLVLQSQENSSLLEALAYLSKEVFLIRRKYFQELKQ